MNSLQILKFYAGGLSKELKCESKIQACDMIDDDVEKVFKNFLKFIYSYAFKNRFTYIYYTNAAFQKFEKICHENFCNVLIYR